MENNILETKEFEILYGKSKDNKTKMWSTKVERYDNYSEIVTLYGFNRMIETRRQINIGKNIGKKNQTSHFQQAISEATSKWTKKRDIEKFMVELVDITHEQIKMPMLAHDYNKQKKKVIFPCYLQPKLDGYRCIYDTNTKTITSRQGKSFDVLKNSGQLFDELNKLQNLGILDGELYIHNEPFESLGLLRKTKSLTYEDMNYLLKIEYHVYDIIDELNSFKIRNENLKKIFIDNKFEKIKYVHTESVNDEESIIKFHEKNIESNYEGTMIRNTLGMYKQKFRSSDLLKYKDFLDGEFKIIDYTFEKDTSGLDENLIVWIIIIKSNLQCKVRPMGTKIERKELYKNCISNFSQYKGRNLWCKYFELTTDGNLRFPTTKTNTFESYIRDDII